VFVEDDALAFKETLLKIRWQRQSGRRTAAFRVDHSMPWNLTSILWRGGHDIADGTSVVSGTKDPGDLSIAHDAAAWDSLNKRIDTFAKGVNHWLLLIFAP
jgi:hypothetical protein